MSKQALWGEVRSILMDLQHEWETRDTYCDQLTIRSTVFWKTLLVCLTTALADKTLTWEDYTKEFVPYIRDVLGQVGGTVWLYESWLDDSSSHPASKLFNGVSLMDNRYLSKLDRSLVRRVAVDGPAMLKALIEPLTRFEYLRALDLITGRGGHDAKFVEALSQLRLNTLTLDEEFPLSVLAELHVPSITVRGHLDLAHLNEETFHVSPKVEKLTFLSCKTDRVVDIATLASPHLKHLNLADTQRFLVPGASPPFREVFPSLEVLCYHTFLRNYPSTEDLLMWFSRDPPDTLRLVLSTDQYFLALLRAEHPHLKTVTERPTFDHSYKLSTWSDSLNTRVLKHS